jgi:hypothetical protein
MRLQGWAITVILLGAVIGTAYLIFAPWPTAVPWYAAIVVGLISGRSAPSKPERLHSDFR